MDYWNSGEYFSFLSPRNGGVSSFVSDYWPARQTQTNPLLSRGTVSLTFMSTKSFLNYQVEKIMIATYLFTLILSFIEMLKFWIISFKIQDWRETDFWQCWNFTITIFDFRKTVWVHGKCSMLCKKIKNNIWISCSSFIRSGSVLSQQRYSAMTLLSWGLVWFLCLMAYQLFIGYLMPKPFSEKNASGTI